MCGWNYLSMLGFKFNHVNKRGSREEKILHFTDDIWPILHLISPINSPFNCIYRMKTTTTKISSKFCITGSLCIFHTWGLNHANDSSCHRLSYSRWRPNVMFHWLLHDDVIKWKHFPRYWPFVRGIHRSPVNSSHKGQWRGALMFSLICARISGWVNNREAGDLRRYRAHYDVIVMVVFSLQINTATKHVVQQEAETELRSVSEKNYSANFNMNTILAGTGSAMIAVLFS